ncbi:MAG: hypothetical protein H7067_12525 [Burkholderiales bacterium]|nr:hypothetical protein [Opitutaceae bacterium]
MPLKEKIQQHRQQLAELHAMEARFEAERAIALAALPAKYGFADTASFVRALRQAHGQNAGSVPSRGPRGRRENRASSLPASLAPSVNAVTRDLPSPAEPPPVSRLPTAIGIAAAAKAAATSIATPASPVSAQSAPSPVRPVSPSLDVSAAPVAVVAPAARTPIGTSLDDPANFGLLPDLALLETPAAPSPDAAARRARLSAALAFATKVLHTSRVPAVVWREWRQFERRATEMLRAGSV